MPVERKMLIRALVADDVKGRPVLRMVKEYVLPKSGSDRKKTDTVLRQAIETKTKKETAL